MLDEISAIPKVSEFLHLYPKSEWKEIIKIVTIVGVCALENAYNRFLPIEELAYIADTTPLPLSFQIPELRSTLNSMQTAIDKINLSLEKENEEMKKTSRKSSLKKTHKPKRSIGPNVLAESTPRFKMLDDIFSKQKWKKEPLREENSPVVSKPPPKSRPLPRPTSAAKKAQEVRNELKLLKIPNDGALTERPFAGSPTLEELLSNSWFTVCEDAKAPKAEEFSESKNSLESSKKQNSSQSKCAVSIAEGFLKNPLISQLAFKPQKPTKRKEVSEEDANSRLSIRSYSPINCELLLEKDEF